MWRLVGTPLGTRPKKTPLKVAFWKGKCRVNPLVSGKSTVRFFRIYITSLKLTASSHLKMDGWNTSFPFRMAYFQVMLVPGRVSDGFGLD